MTESIVSGNFTFRRTKLADVIVVEPKVYGDARGFFMETYKRDDFVKRAASPRTLCRTTSRTL